MEFLYELSLIAAIIVVSFYFLLNNLADKRLNPSKPGVIQNAIASSKQMEDEKINEEDDEEVLKPFSVDDLLTKSEPSEKHSFFEDTENDDGWA